MVCASPTIKAKYAGSGTPWVIEASIRRIAAVCEGVLPSKTWGPIHNLWLLAISKPGCTGVTVGNWFYAILSRVEDVRLKLPCIRQIFLCTCSYSLFPELPKLTCLQAIWASSDVQFELLRTVPHTPLRQISTRPSLSISPSISRKLPSSHSRGAGNREENGVILHITISFCFMNN